MAEKMRLKWIEAWRDQGFYVRENLFDHETCDAVVAAAENLPTYKDGSLTPFMHPHKEDDIFLDVRRNELLVTLMSELITGSFKGEISGLQTQFFFGRPGTIGFNKHQDNFYAKAEHGNYASAWIALTDTDPENGGLIVYPGSHKEGILEIRETLTDNTFGQDPNAIAKEVICPDRYKPVDVIAPKGSVVFVHGNLIHDSHDNISNRYRHVLLITYILKGGYFNPGRSAKRKEINVR